MAERRPRAALAVVLLAGLLVSSPTRSSAATSSVAVRDNRFDPVEIRIDPGDTVVWSYASGRSRHTVTSDERGGFSSGDMIRGDSFSQRFGEAGFYPYFCRQHGARGGVGMAGVVIVGNPSEPGGPGGEPDGDDRLVVPSEFPTIQAAVDHAEPGATVVVRPGVYRESVVVRTPRLTIKGVDRFRAIVDGGGTARYGIVVDGFERVRILNLTVRAFTESGVYFTDVTGYTVARVDAINNGVYGIHAFDSYDGVIRDSYAWGSGDAGFHIGQCLACSALLDNVHAEYNLVGYSGTNATGVMIRDSTFVDNAVGLWPNSLALEGHRPNRGTIIYGNDIRDNNNTELRATGFWTEVGAPTGTGVWLAGTHLNTVTGNRITDHDRYGVLVSQSADGETVPVRNATTANHIRGSKLYELAWDGTGSDNCFSGNDIAGPTGPPDAQQAYGCDKRPFAGTPYPPVQADLAAALASASSRGGSPPPYPQRPDCQKGRPGCR